MKKNLHSIGEYLWVDDGTIYKGRKTTLWCIYAADGETLLGYVKWYGPWRCYAFGPSPGTIFEQRCMRSIAQFCEGSTKRHREHNKMLKDSAVTAAQQAMYYGA